MRSGRHGAARPPIGVLIQQDRIYFSLFALLVVASLVLMALTGWASPVFWAAPVLIIGSVALIVRRVNALARAEVNRDEELL